MRKKIFIIFAIFSLTTFSLEEDSQFWSQNIFQTPLVSKFNGYFELQPRIDMQASRMQRVLVRPAIYYSLTDELTVWLGYLWMPVFFPLRNDEHRIWEQLIYTKKIGESIILNRLRFEQRFFDSNFALKLRNLLRFQHQWFVIYDEIFFHLASGYDQNRIFLGLHFKFSDQVRIEAGYMNNHIRVLPNDKMNHIFLVTLFIQNK